MLYLRVDLIGPSPGCRQQDLLKKFGNLLATSTRFAMHNDLFVAMDFAEPPRNIILQDEFASNVGNLVFEWLVAGREQADPRLRQCTVSDLSR